MGAKQMLLRMEESVFILPEIPNVIIDKNKC